MKWNLQLFFKINGLVGRNKWLDAFGRAGGEWVIIAMFAWFVVSIWIDRSPDWWDASLPLVFFGSAALVGWAINFLLAEIVNEPRPYVTHPNAKKLFTPLQGWKAFPSDHALFAWLLFFVAVLFALPGFEMLFPMALWVSWGRVYSGMHYPQDILGGMAVAFGVTLGGYYII